MKQSIFTFTLWLVLAAQSFAQAQPDPIAAAIAEARTLINEGAAKAAVTKLQSLPEEFAAKDIRVVHLLGVAYYHAGRLPRAIETLTPIVDKLPPDSAQRREATQSLGLAHFLAGHMVDAIPFLERTCEWAPNNNELAYAIGTAYLQTRQPAKAR